MTYAIGQLVYGLNLQEPSPYDANQTDIFADFRDEFEEIREIDVSHITGDKYGTLLTSHYSGGGDGPFYFGIDLGQIEETETTMGADLIKMLTVTNEQKLQYQKLLEKLKEHVTPALHQLFAEQEPYTFLTWGSS